MNHLEKKSHPGTVLERGGGGKRMRLLSVLLYFATSPNVTIYSAQRSRAASHLTSGVRGGSDTCAQRRQRPRHTCRSRLAPAQLQVRRSCEGGRGRRRQVSQGRPDPAARASWTNDLSLCQGTRPLRFTSLLHIEVTETELHFPQNSSES